MQRACLAGCKELISFMLECGADIDIQSINGDSPVYLVVHAMCKGKIKNFEPLKILVDAGMSFFVFRIRYVNMNMIFMVLGCSVNCVTNNKYTALHVAAFYGKDDLVLWLLLNGADPEPQHCLSPSECARKAGKWDLLLFFLIQYLKFVLISGHFSTASLLDVNTDDVSFDNTE